MYICMVGCAYLCMVHVVLLRVCTQFTTCRNDVIFVLFGSYYYPHRTVIILRNTIINNNLRGLRFLFRMFGTLAGGENPGPGRPENNWAQCLADDIRVFQATEGSTDSSPLLFGEETVLCPWAAKKSGKWYRGVCFR